MKFHRTGGAIKWYRWRHLYQFMAPPVSTAICLLSGCSPVRLIVRPFSRYQIYERDNLKTNEPIWLQIGTNDPRAPTGQGDETINFVVRRSKVKITLLRC